MKKLFLVSVLLILIVSAIGCIPMCKPPGHPVVLFNNPTIGSFPTIPVTDTWGIKDLGRYKKYHRLLEMECWK